MRWSELARKEIVDITTGRRLGTFRSAEILLDETTGKILGLEFSQRNPGVGERGNLRLSWNAIRKVGPDTVLVDPSLQ
ncbi:MAG: YlmC/YmxH family sporulation protein [Firmicutes bacterium]|nr:YlmC/YmxH family sporulation protein [Bacillota bacterium]